MNEISVVDKEQAMRKTNHQLADGLQLIASGVQMATWTLVAISSLQAHPSGPAIILGCASTIAGTGILLWRYAVLPREVAWSRVDVARVVRDGGPLPADDE